MPETIEIEEFLKNSKHISIVDVRSPGEFEHGHIPGALNIPVFDNEERAQVGTIYKKKGKELAIALGYEIVGPKLKSFADLARTHSRDGKLLVHCWRGGMRSGKMAEFFEAGGVTTQILNGGYKTYRNHVLTHFGDKLHICLLGGETGSGKTEILKQLAAAGEQVIDLEELASHRGSTFGAIGMNPQPTVETFENNLFSAISKIDPKRKVWIEAESRSIGRVFIPAPLWEQMEAAPFYRLQVPFEVRVQRLVIDYGNFPKEILQEALDRIKKRLGGLDHKNASEALQTGDMAEFIRMALRYYDKAYIHPLEKRKLEEVISVPCESGDPEANAKRILEIINS